MNYDFDLETIWDPAAKSLEKKVMDLFKQGYAPSEIDRKLNLSTGQAHDVVCHYWRFHT